MVRLKHKFYLYRCVRWNCNKKVHTELRLKQLFCFS